jgi:GntR family transcriptional regulator
MSTFTVDKQSPVPYYYQIEEWIRGKISSGILKPGDMLPNEISLSEQLGVSRMTVRQALKNLTSEGILIRHRAKGTFIAPHRSQIPFVRDQLRSVTEEVTTEGHQLSSQVLTLELHPATGELLRDLQLQPGDQVILIRRLRCIEDGPISIENAYHPFQLFPELLNMDLTDKSIYLILHQKYNSRPVEAVDTLVASVSTPEESQLLEIEPGDPVMHYKRIAMDSTGKRIECTRAIYRADRYQIVIRYQRGGDPGS